MDCCLLKKSIYYSKFKSKYFEDFVIEQFNTFHNITYFIDRDTEYNQNGRIHTLEQAKDADQKLKDILEKHNIEYTTVKTTEATDIITDHILDILNMK